MKKAVIVFIVAALVIITTLVWIFSGSGKINPVELVSLGVIILVVAFAIFIGYKRFTSVKRGEPAEDEMSKKVMQRTSSLAYYISLYMWLAIMYFSDKFKYETHTVIGGGILGMAVIFGICWLVFNFKGVRSE
jgi:peptidoglycan/LPS O-acetylase OafA/YrhL